MYVDQFNNVGVFNTSSRKLKHDITPMDKASETLYQFKPVTFRYNSDWKGTTQYGLIAEEVAEVDPQLVVRGRDGEIYGRPLRADQQHAAQRESAFCLRHFSNFSSLCRFFAFFLPLQLQLFLLWVRPRSCSLAFALHRSQAPEYGSEDGIKGTLWGN